jgi:membrane-bound ClpP family serine protease
MELFGLSLETIYLYALIFSGSLIVLYVLFGDMAEGFGEALGIFNPVLVLAFITFMSASGYLFELLTSLNSFLIMGISALIALGLDTLLNVFVLIPLSSAEESLAYSEDSLRGRIATVLISIPEDGYGEILIESYSGRISKPAACFHNGVIGEGEKVLVVDIKEGVLYVVPENKIGIDRGN